MAVRSELVKMFRPLFLVGLIVCQTSAEEGTPHGEWPFNSPLRPDVPHVEQSGWLANPIDAFILQKLETKGLRPNRVADGNELLRRVSFDLTSSMSINQSSSRISQKTGVAPVREIDSAVAPKVNGVVITSSPSPTPNASSPRYNASVPEPTPTAFGIL